MSPLFLAVIMMFFVRSCVADGTLEPKKMHDNETTTCEEFGRYARFNPNSVLNVDWLLFYYWAPVQHPMMVNFTIPTKKQIAYLQYILNGHVLDPINWEARMLLMTEKNNMTYLLVEQGDRGEYRLYQPMKDLEERQLLPSLEIRLKQVGPHYIGLMTCEEQMAYAFAKVTNVPKKNELQDEAAKIGFRGHGGLSYLYQGHQWMPIPEGDGVEDMPIEGDGIEDMTINRYESL